MFLIIQEPCTWWIQSLCSPSKWQNYNSWEQNFTMPREGSVSTETKHRVPWRSRGSRPLHGVIFFLLILNWCQVPTSQECLLLYHWYRKQGPMQDSVDQHWPWPLLFSLGFYWTLSLLLFQILFVAVSFSNDLIEYLLQWFYAPWSWKYLLLITSRKQSSSLGQALSHTCRFSKWWMR